MKKAIAVCVFAAVMAVFTGCSDNTAESTSTQSAAVTTTAEEESAETTTADTEQTTEEATASEDTETTTAEAEEETTAEEATEAELGAELDDEECKKVAAELMSDLNFAERIGGGVITCDGNQPLAGNEQYCKVTDWKSEKYDFKSTDEYRKFLKDRFGGNVYDRYIVFADGEDPLLTDGPDGVYSKFAAKGTRYNFTDDTEVSITAKTENTFTAEAEYELTGATIKVTMHFLNENGTWIMDNISDTDE